MIASVLGLLTLCAPLIASTQTPAPPAKSPASPQAAGIKAMLPHVSSLVACHNLGSLQDLSDHLNGRRGVDHKARLMRLLA